MWQFIFTFYGYFVFFYSLLLIFSYIFLIVMAYSYTSHYKRWTLDYVQQMVETSPFTPGVSIVAPAYNEGVNIVENVNSLLQQKYPKFEVIIVNDGSKDDTLEKLIDNFSLIEVPYDYVYHINCKPFKRLFRSTDYHFKNLTVVDKTNGGTKADAVNGGLNVASLPGAVFEYHIPKVPEGRVQDSGRGGVLPAHPVLRCGRSGVVCPDY